MSGEQNRYFKVPSSGNVTISLRFLLVLTKIFYLQPPNQIYFPHLLINIY